MSAAKYRVCFNQRPHSADWWTVERKRVFGWRTEKKYLPGYGMYVAIPRVFETEEAANAWIAEEKRPVVHRCGPAQ